MASVDEPPLGDVESVVALYREHAEPLLVFFVRRTLDGEAAADLAAETFAQALSSRERFPPRARVTSSDRLQVDPTGSSSGFHR
jgi:DNA-directed RNA polymerase specialized sigma24 family protein